MSSAHDAALLRPPATEGAGGVSAQPYDDGARASPNRIIEIGYAFWRSKALLSAVELQVFTILAEDALDLENLTRRLGLHERGARDFFDALKPPGQVVAQVRHSATPEFLPVRTEQAECPPPGFFGGRGQSVVALSRPAGTLLL
jgi:hypothetical protein